MSASLRRWLWRAAKSNPRTLSADSTGMLRNVPTSTPSTSDTREDARLELSMETLRRRGIQLTAWGTSMLPSLWPGDVLTIEPAEHQKIIAGDIVLVLHNHRFFVHRVIEKRENGCSFWITRGDSMPQSDPPAIEADLLGKVVRVARGSRIFTPMPRISMLHSVLAWVLCRSGRMRSAALRIHSARVGSARSSYFVHDAFGAARSQSAADSGSCAFHA
jgi:Peptidase S24-like